MKNKRIICCILSLALLFCVYYQNKEVYSIKNAEYILFDNEHYYLCGIDESHNSVETYDKVRRNPDVNDIGYIYEFSFDYSDITYLKTQTNTKRYTYLQTFSKDGKEGKTIKLKNNFYTACVDKNKLYAISSFVDENPYLILDVFDTNLCLNFSKKFEYDAAIIFPSGIVVSEDIIYLFCAIIYKDSSYGEVANYLFEFDKEFNLQKSTDLKLYESSYQHAYKIGDIIYLAKTTEGLDKNKYAKGSNNIDVYNLKTGELISNYISLEYAYPKHIRYDKENDNIIFMHDRYSLGMNVYSVYNLKTKTVESLKFINSEYGDNSVYFSLGKDNYYFQTPDILAVYNLTNKSFAEYNLDELNLDLLPGIVVL